jgi:hypothetical protein
MEARVLIKAGVYPAFFLPLCQWKPESTRDVKPAESRQTASGRSTL